MRFPSRCFCLAKAGRSGGAAMPTREETQTVRRIPGSLHCVELKRARYIARAADRDSPAVLKARRSEEEFERAD